MMIPHLLKWPGSHRRLAPRMIAEGRAALDGADPTAIVDLTVGGGGFLIEAMQAWPSARLLLADTCAPLARLWLDLSTPDGADAVEAVMAREAALWGAADAAASTAEDGAAEETRLVGKRLITATRAKWARFDARRAWHAPLRARWNAANLRHLAAGPLADLSPETGRRHSGEFAALLRGSYKGLCRFSNAGQYNVGCAAEPSHGAGRQLYEAGAAAALGRALAARRARVACAPFGEVLAGVAGLLKGALVILDPPFPGGFVAFSPRCSAPPISALADAAAWASACGAAVLVNHPAEGAAEWRERLPGADVHVDLVRQGAMEPSPTGEAPRKDKPELLAVLRPLA